MCGFAGLFLQPKDPFSLEALPSLLVKMSHAIAHRGPDDSGMWVDQTIGFGLTHQRLAIVDLSSAGHQPMVSSSGRYVLAFNGEIYNHKSLRGKLDRAGFCYKWNGHSDTETVLAAIESWGLSATLRMLTGMFALALWDVSTGKLSLARDRIGEKPIYYGWASIDSAPIFAFGSELKAIEALPGFSASISRDALSQYLRYKYVPCPLSIYEGIFKLPPGHLLEASVGVHNKELSHAPEVGVSYQKFMISQWWDLMELPRNGSIAKIKSEADALSQIHVALSASVSAQSIADVKSGVFLSGGIDSSLVSALAQESSGKKIDTFTAGFKSSAFDESIYAREVSSYLKTNHHEMVVSESDALGVVPLLPKIYDEPFSDASQIPTYLLCKSTKNFVKVALSGDGGDEVFGGYNRYIVGPKIWRYASLLPVSCRKKMGHLVGKISESDLLSYRLLDFFGNNKIPQIGNKMKKISLALKHSEDKSKFYQSFKSTWQHPTSALIKACPDDSGQIYQITQSFDYALAMMLADSATYLPDDILCKVDRASMAVGLEVRAPFLDHHVMELAWQLPLSMKIRGNQGKWILRQILSKYLPGELIDRPKFGFGAPISEWLRGALKDWANELLREDALRSQGYFNVGMIKSLWNEHKEGRADHSEMLWTILIFQEWLKTHEKYHGS